VPAKSFELCNLHGHDVTYEPSLTCTRGDIRPDTCLKTTTDSRPTHGLERSPRDLKVSSLVSTVYEGFTVGVEAFLLQTWPCFRLITLVIRLLAAGVYVVNDTGYSTSFSQKHHALARFTLA